MELEIIWKERGCFDVEKEYVSSYHVAQFSPQMRKGRLWDF